MLNMQAFHTLLSTSSDAKDSYVSAMAVITQLSADKLNSLTSDLDWDYWGDSATSPAKA